MMLPTEQYLHQRSTYIHEAVIRENYIQNSTSDYTNPAILLKPATASVTQCQQVFGL